MRLNLGCNDDHKAGYVNVDQAQPADVIADLRTTWPWRTSSVEDIVAHDVFEHLPSKIFTLNEAHRVLMPGGCLDFWVPLVSLSDGRINPGAFADPTHSSFWTMDDRYYFCEEWNNSQGERGRLGPAYGITALFKPLSWQLFEYGAGHERRSKLKALLQAVK
jgi:Methyltransferase domain